MYNNYTIIVLLLCFLFSQSGNPAFIIQLFASYSVCKTKTVGKVSFLAFLIISCKRLKFQALQLCMLFIKFAQPGSFLNRQQSYEYIVVCVRRVLVQAYVCGKSGLVAMRNRKIIILKLFIRENLVSCLISLTFKCTQSAMISLL